MSQYTLRSTWWLVTAYGDNTSRIQDGRTFPAVVKQVKGQMERCPTTGRDHFQGAVQCFGQQRAAFFRDWLPGVHFEVAKSAQAVQKYCTKSETRIGDPVEVFNPDDFMTMDKGMMKLASASLDKDTDPVDSEYWDLVNVVIRESPRLISMYAAPAFRTAWNKTRSTWRAIVLHARRLEEEENSDKQKIPAVSTIKDGNDGTAQTEAPLQEGSAQVGCI